MHGLCRASQTVLLRKQEHGELYVSILSRDGGREEEKSQQKEKDSVFVLRRLGNHDFGCRKLRKKSTFSFADSCHRSLRHV